MNKREQGSHYETMAAEYLKNKGYEIILQNFFSKNGEIDIIAKYTDTLVFCEVKYRSNTRYGLPEEAVDYRKQDKIRKTAAYYLYRNNFPALQDSNTRNYPLQSVPKSDDDSYNIRNLISR